MRQPIASGTLAVLAMVTFMLGAMPAWADDLEDANTAYKRGDFATALGLLRPLAEKGNAGAQFNLGVSYFKGEGVAQDNKEAEKWFRLAAQQGYVNAQSSLGVMYLMRNDFKGALPWIQGSADQGYPPSQSNLGIMYANGQGVAKNYVRAHLWFSLAAAQGDANAANNRDSVAKLMTPAQIAEAQKMTQEWKPK
jgi:hypothetical protein